MEREGEEWMWEKPECGLHVAEDEDLKVKHAGIPEAGGNGPKTCKGLGGYAYRVWKRGAAWLISLI